MDLLYKKKELWSTDGKFVNLMDGIKDEFLGPAKAMLKNYKPPRYKFAKFEKPENVWKAAFNSERVQSIIKQISQEDKLALQSVKDEAIKILKEMAYADHMTVVRTLGFVLLTVAKSIYPEGIFINIEAVDKLKELVQHYPVVFIPSHRSYMDFLIFSVICFCVDLPLPAIASGMDFMGMKFLGEALRSSGAFFMRRSFGTDRLYWALFTEYVHAAIVNGSRTMEFFIEGTRSRSGKSLNPKLGLLSVIAEPYLKGQIFDTIIVPVGVSYQRILEESLYAYELLGIPKPKESTSGLISSASVLKESYGSIHVQFAQPISLRNNFSSVDRLHHGKSPSYLQHLSTIEQKELQVLAYNIVKLQQKNMIIGLWPAIALVLSCNQYCISLSNLIKELQWLRGVCQKCEIKVKWTKEGMGVGDSVLQTLDMFKHIVTVRTCLDSDGEFVHREVEINAITASSAAMKLGVSSDAVNYVMLANYRNQILDGFVGPGLLALSLKKNSSIQSGASATLLDVFEDFKFLCKNLRNDFIFVPGSLKALFEKSLDILKSFSAVVVNGGKSIELSSHSEKIFQFLGDIFSPFIQIQVLVASYFIQFPKFDEEKQAKTKLQKWICNSIGINASSFELLSLDLIQNAVMSLSETKCLNLSRIKGKKWIFADKNNLERHLIVLQQYSIHKDLASLYKPKL